ncbi:methyl-accepting chemotaxis protein, partial [Mangrovibrevibacter kandeliae]|uniref:methyl-accepting chemotaxis protein n=1 Tax=Mangrovibrevibacter kandeliae TaxID=2968473 RepID=UPI0021186330
MKIRSNRLKRAVMTALVVLIAFVVGGQIVVDRMLVGGSDELADQSKLWLATSRKALDLAQLTKEIELNLVQVQQFLTDVSATRGLDGLNDGFDLAKENAAAFARNVAAARGLASDLKADQIIGTLDGLTAAFPGFYDVGQKMARAYVADGPEGGNRIMGEFDGQAEALGAAVEATKSSMSDLLTRIDAEAQAGESALNGSNATAKTIAMVIAGVTMLLGVGIALFIRRSLLTPLGHAIDSLDRLADGEDVPDLAGIDRKDEMGDLARAFASFKRAGAEKTRIEAEAKAAREAQVAERERQMAAEQAKAEELKGFVHDIEAGFERLAEGDLTVRMERPVAEE